MTTVWKSLALMMFFITVINHHKVVPCPSVARDTVVSCTGRPCHNGECVLTHYGPMVFERCVCDPGWDGRFCDICSVDSPLYIEKDSDEALTTEGAIAVTINPSMSLPIPVPSYNDCKAPKRAESKTCGRRGLQCQNGDCKEEMIGPWNIQIIKCGDPCDDGWTGSNCDICCDLQCSAGSKCVIEGFDSYKTMNCTPSSLVLPTSPRTPESESQTEINGLTTESGCYAEERSNPTWCHTYNCYNGNCTTLNDTKQIYGNVSSISYLLRPHYSCTCDPGWIGQYCDQCCDLNCNNGTCDLNINGQMYCNCYHGYRGSDCLDLVPTTTPPFHDRVPDWYWYVIGFGLGIFVIILISMISLAYYLWTRRHPLIVQFARHFQNPEGPADGKLYDAYVSYSETSCRDESFVMRILYPRLQRDLGYKLYTPSRDTIPGSGYIQDRMIEGIEQSRRSILLISPDYLVDEWPKLEYLTAQWEMLAKRHCIIPILFTDIRHVENIDPVIANIMKGIKCLKWPQEGGPKKEDKFWKHLELLMPKRDVENDQQPQSFVKFLKSCKWEDFHCFGKFKDGEHEANIDDVETRF